MRGMCEKTGRSDQRATEKRKEVARGTGRVLERTDENLKLRSLVVCLAPQAVYCFSRSCVWPPRL